jgi:rod shape-determining protein MreD
LVQSILLSRVSLLGGRPNLILLSVIAWGVLRGSTEGAVWAFIGGLVLDLLSGGPMGAMTLALLIVSFLAGRGWRRELGSAVMQLVLLTLGLCFVYHILLLLILGWTGYPVNWAYGLGRVAAPSAILNAVLVPLVYFPLVWLDRRTRAEGLTFEGA